ncbi:MAG: metallophosphoesterase [Candidatus Bathyarchaeia archaeon]
MPDKKFTKIFFATDLHGSSKCYEKILSAAKFYKVDVLVLGGDMTGKMLVPIVDYGNGTFKADYIGEKTLHSPDEVKSLEREITDSGYYPYPCSKAEMDELNASKEKVDKVFMSVMKDTLLKWVDRAEPFLSELGVTCYLTGGNDDYQEIVDAVQDTPHVKNADHKVLKIDELHEMVNLGWSNPTPWKCPRDHTEEELETMMEKLVSSVSDKENCVFNVHVPPINCGLDTVPKLDDSVYPPKPVIDKGQAVMIGAGSTSIRRAIEKYQPLVDLCGHIHESRGTTRIGRTLVLNPGSEYPEGTLRGAIVNIADKKVLSFQLTSG